MHSHLHARLTRPLSRLPLGSRGQVEALAGGQGMVAQLAAMGLRPGSAVLVTGQAGGTGPVSVLADGIRLAVGGGMADRIMVQPIPGEPFPAGPPTLAEARTGDRVRVTRLGGHGAIRQRLLDMGILRGVELTVERYAPLRDPLQITVKGYSLALRVDDARGIEIEWLPARSVKAGNEELPD
jgi:Fur family ferric uptake transcriptional regulator